MNNIKQLLDFKQQHNINDLNKWLDYNAVYNRSVGDVHRSPNYGILVDMPFIALMSQLGVDEEDITWGQELILINQEFVVYQIKIARLADSVYADFDTLQVALECNIVQLGSRNKNTVTLELIDLPSKSKKVSFVIEYGTSLHLYTDFLNLKPITEEVDRINSPIMDNEGCILYALDTQDSFISKLRFVHERGIKLSIEKSLDLLPNCFEFSATSVFRTPYFELKYER